MRSRFALLIAFLLLVTTAPASSLTVLELRCEGVLESAQVDTPAPRFSWQFDSAARATCQTAFQLRITEDDGNGEPMAAAFETPRIESDASQWVVAPGFAPKPRASYAWQVRVWDNHGAASEWSDPAQFGTGLLGGAWPADWIGDGRLLPLHATAPARHFRGDFKVEKPPVRARLFVSACGLVEPWINGRRVTEDLFIPGWPDYRSRVFYAAFDVTQLLRAGDNTLGAILGDGWFSGTMIPRHQYGAEATFSAFIELVDADGNATTVGTGKDWRWTDAGPIRMNSIYHGETYDTRNELGDWCEPGPRDAGDEAWREVTTRPSRVFVRTMMARMSPPVRRIEELKPADVRVVSPGVRVYDLGQNMVGWARLRVRAEAGAEIKLRFAEMLDAEGNLFTANLRAAKATATYIAKGEGVEEWEPRFTYFGFRYVELSGVDEPLDDAIVGVVVHTDLPRTGGFKCSDPLLNQLFSNALWSQKGNFLELPTDCPQRDERAGWTGDAQVFAPTALYNMDAGAFYRQWLFSVRDGLRDGPGGGYPDVAPFTGFGHGSAGWAEAGVIIPWTVWLHTGDRRVLEENLPAIQHALELMAAESPDGIRRSRQAWGDWLSPGYPLRQAPPRYELIATAFFAHAADLAARIADALDRPELAASNRALHDKVRAAFQREYIDADGRVADDVQTSYLLALAFDLVPAELRPRVAEHLARTVVEKDNHLATGFLGTPLLTPTLTDIGRADLAYAVLQQTTFPGWLFPVKNGATTIWERWDSWTPEEGFNKDGMNSFNHYAYGSVVAWLYDTVAGIGPLAGAPGWKRFRVAHAAASLGTPYGVAASSWRIENGSMRLSVRIPAGTRAEIVLPAGDLAAITLDGAPLAGSALAAEPRSEGDRTFTTLSSGKYEFALPVPARP